MEKREVPLGTLRSIARKMKEHHEANTVMIDGAPNYIAELQRYRYPKQEDTQWLMDN